MSPPRIPKKVSDKALHELEYHDAVLLAKADPGVHHRLQHRFEVREANLRIVCRAAEDILAIRTIIFAFCHRENGRRCEDLPEELKAYLGSRFDDPGILDFIDNATGEFGQMNFEYTVQLKLGSTLLIRPYFASDEDPTMVFVGAVLGVPGKRVVFLTSESGGGINVMVRRRDGRVHQVITRRFYDVPNVRSLPFEIRDALETLTYYLLNRARWDGRTGDGYLTRYHHRCAEENKPKKD